MTHFTPWQNQQLIVGLAGRRGEDPALALATGTQESGLRHDAVGDNGCSIGTFQSNRCGGAGVGYSVAELMDPERNAEHFFDRVSRARRSCIGCTPGEIAYAAQRPADRAGYIAKVNALYRQFAPDVAQAPVHPFDAARALSDVATDIASAPARAKDALVDTAGTHVVLLLLALLAILLIVGVFA